jgi:hypothetical protein
VFSRGVASLDAVKENVHVHASCLRCQPSESVGSPFPGLGICNCPRGWLEAGHILPGLAIALYHDDVLHSFHVLTIPWYDRKTADVITDAIYRAVDIIAPQWRIKLIAVSIDVERTMTGRISGVATKIAAHRIMRVWCGLHQIDLVAQWE